MVFLLVRLKSESSGIFLCPSPKHQLLTELFIDVQSPVLLEVNASQLAARGGVWGLCLSPWSVRAWQSKVGGFCLWGWGREVMACGEGRAFD